MMNTNLKRLLIVAMLVGFATPSFADDAPVYDADTGSQQQFDGSSSSSYDSAPATPATSVPRDSYAPSQPMQSLSLDQRLTRIENQMNNLDQSKSSAKVDSLQNQVQSLRNQVEELNHQLQQVQTQQKAMYSDLDKRVNTKSSVATNKNSSNVDTSSTGKKIRLAAAVAPTEQPNVAEEQQIYETAYNLIKAKKYNQAISALQRMLQKYPTGQFAANAHYWLGELYNLLGNNDQSSAEFMNVIKSYPNSPKVADAQLKIGLISAGQFKWSEAKAAFKKVINQYPGSSSARLAAEQLKQIKLAGH